jgi:hypothetical protein
VSKTTRQFKRQFLGYRRSAVDDHLATVDASIADLRAAVDKAAHPDHQDLVLRATRRAVEDVMQRAHDDATRIRDEAEAEAAQVLADAYAIAGRRDEVIDLRAAAAAEPTAVDEVQDEPHGELRDDEQRPSSLAPSTDPAAEPAAKPASEFDEPAADPDWNADLAKVITD